MSYKETADDLNKKYHNTFVKYKGQVALVSNFEEGGKFPGEVVVFKAHMPGVSGAQPCVLAEGDIEPIFFDATFVNNTEFRANVSEPAIPAVLVRRKPKRQWKRGLCKENTSVFCPMIPLYTAFGRPLATPATELTHALIKRLLAPTYPTLSQARELCNQYQAVAVSPLFAICLSNVSENRHLLISHFGFIGELDSHTIFVRHHPALQEVRDFVSRTNQSIEVVAG